MKWLRLVVVGALLGLGISLFIKLGSTAPATCSVHYRRDLTVRVGSHLLAAENAKTDIQREKGLGGRDCIGTNQAMLFTFDKPGIYPFWMKDMKFAIDMVWISPNHKVVTVKSNVEPSTYPENFKNSAPAQYVLEIRAGQAEKLGIQQGTEVSF